MVKCLDILGLVGWGIYLIVVCIILLVIACDILDYIFDL